jgi:hypothetical protein
MALATSYFQDRLAHLGQQKQELDSKPVQYVPAGGAEPITWQASVGAIKVVEQTSDGIVNEYQARDYVGDFAALGTTPNEGDRIVDGDLVCEVMPVGGNSYQFTTERRTRIRIHTKVVAA